MVTTGDLGAARARPLGHSPAHASSPGLRYQFVLPFQREPKGTEGEPKGTMQRSCCRTGLIFMKLWNTGQ